MQAVHSLRVLALMALFALVASMAPAARAQSTAPLPNSIASTGDSITRAFNTGSFPFIDAPSNSWTTGTSSSVNSLYSRIRARNSAISGRTYNNAVTGAKAAGLPSQVSRVVGQRPDFATVLIGANDVCASSEGPMTSVSTFRSQITTALSTIATQSPNTRIYVVSIPNIYNLWNVLRFNVGAIAVWETVGICQSMLDNPLSYSSADSARRLRVQQHNIALNTQLREVCAMFPQCRFDNNAAYNTSFSSSDVSSRDYFHPNVTGQAKLASVTWTASGLAP